jgi:hypothetical protein
MSVDLVTTIVVSALTSGATKVVQAPLEAVGEHLKERVKRRLERTLDRANAKNEGRPLEAADRITAKVLNEAAWTDDELTSDYLGGVLAASGPDDDSGAPVVAQIGRLSADQLRFHYVVYRELRRLWPASASMNLYRDSEASSAGVRLPLLDLVAALGDGVAKVSSTIGVLVTEGLLGDRWDYTAEGAADEAANWSARVRPTARGAELFLWGHGAAAHASALFQRDAALTMLTQIPDTPNASLLNPPATPSPEAVADFGRVTVPLSKPDDRDPAKRRVPR